MRPCSVTGSENPHMLEYHVLVEWERLGDEGLTHIEVHVGQDAFEADNELISDRINSVGADCCAENFAKLEQSYGTEMQREQEAKDLDTFKNNARSLVRQFQDFQVEIELLGSSSRGVVRGSEGPSPSFDEMPRHVAQRTHLELTKFSARFGCTDAKTRPQKSN